MEERSEWWKQSNIQDVDLEKLFSPLNYTQIYFLRIQVRDALEEAFSLPDKVRPNQKCSEEESIKQLDWHKISAAVGAKCPDSPQHDPDTYRKVWSRVWLTKEGTVYIHDERLVYEILPRMVNDPWMLFYNLGYDSTDAVPLTTDETYWKYAAQLYHHVASQVDITGKDIIEVGCGRGGGAAHTMIHFNPKSYKAMDISFGNIEKCKNTHKYPKLEFFQGDATKLPFADASCDVLFNVESSHSYPSMSAFLNEVSRVLRPGGYLCFVDSRHKDEIDVMRNDLISSGLVKVKDIDISKNVADALEKFKPMIGQLLESKGVKKDTGKRNAYEQLLYDLCNRWFPHFSSGKYIYLSCTLQKPIHKL